MNTTHPQQDCPKIPHTESNHKNKTNDENPVGNFITWLTTTTPPTTPVLEIDVAGEKERMEAILCKETAEKQESLLLSTPSREQQPSSPSRSPLILSLTRRRKKEQQQVNKPKEFGELVSIHIPDLERTIQNRVFELAEQQHNSSNNSNSNNDGDDDARPHLPSHVPTPDTLHTNEDHSTSIGLHHHLQTMIFHNKNNNDAVDHTNYHKGMEIKYAPSPITPPQSPARTTKNKTLAIPLAATKSKWGPDFWNSKKKSLLTSTSSNMCMDVSSSSLVADDSSDFDDSSTTSLSKTKAKTKTKRPSSPSSVMDCNITNTAAVTTTPPPLQLQWMHENALNLQSMRDSIRYCGDYDEVDDNNDDNDNDNEGVSSMSVVHAQHHYRHEELECSMLLPRTPSLLELATMDEQ